MKIILYCSASKAVCVGEALVVASTEKDLQVIDDRLHPIFKFSKPTKLKKIKFGEILDGLTHGAAYAFDQQSYDRFYPIANSLCHELKAENLSARGDTGIHLITISL